MLTFDSVHVLPQHYKSTLSIMIDCNFDLAAIARSAASAISNA